jgi:hypothetical protein
MTTFPPTTTPRQSDAKLPANIEAQEDELNEAFQEAETAFLKVYGESGYTWQMS